MADIAAALAVMAQDGRSLLLEPEPPAAKREKREGAGQADRTSSKPAERTAGTARPPRGASRESKQPMAVYRLSVGRRQKVNPSQIVGALANEGGLRREDFGHIDIKIDHSLVELPAKLSKDVFSKLARTRISGQLIELRPEPGVVAGRIKKREVDRRQEYLPRIAWARKILLTSGSIVRRRALASRPRPVRRRTHQAGPRPPASRPAGSRRSPAAAWRSGTPTPSRTPCRRRR